VALLENSLNLKNCSRNIFFSLSLQLPGFFLKNPHQLLGPGLSWKKLTTIMVWGTGIASLLCRLDKTKKFGYEPRRKK
jgi:hypothetical protein